MAADGLPNFGGDLRREGILPSLARASAPNHACVPEERTPSGVQGRQNAFPPRAR